MHLPSINEEECKIHLAVWNGQDNPFDVFLSGRFEEWQSWQSRRNFERKYIISLIQLPGVNNWLFAGGYSSVNSEFIEQRNYYQYKTKELKEFNSLSGRLILQFQRSGRQSYLNAENWSNKIIISELKPEKLVIEEFSGYNKVKLTRGRLQIVITQNIQSWNGALANVSGVYLITDTKTGKLYVGSATGDGGIWKRWSEYAENGHGGNKELVSLLQEKGEKYADNFQYSVLEIADTHSSANDVLARESYWKDVLCSREHGYNAN
jgi:hypothetical protein